MSRYATAQSLPLHRGALRERKSLPLFIKGRWHGEAVTKGIKSDRTTVKRFGTDNPSVCPLGSQLPLHRGALGERKSLPLFIKGRWHGEAVTEGIKSGRRPPTTAKPPLCS